MIPAPDTAPVAAQERDMRMRAAAARAPRVLPKHISDVIVRDLHSLDALGYLTGAQAHGLALAAEVMALPLLDGQ